MSTTLPKIFVYNPTCEIAIANDTVSYTPNKRLSRFEKDLDILPMYFAEEKDVVLIRQLPDPEFKSVMQKAGIPIPNFKLFDQSVNDKAFINTPKESLEPWGWSPNIHHVFNRLKDSCQQEFKNRPNSYWKATHKDLYSRKKAWEVLNFFLAHTDPTPYIERGQTAKIGTSITEIKELIANQEPIVIKAPWSSSGRGLRILRQPYIDETIIQWINGILDTQTYVMVEPLLDKKHDFSLQYHIDARGEVTYIGNGFFGTNSKGQYDCNILGGMPKEIKEFLSNTRMQTLSEGIKKAVISCGIAQNYCGYLGVDCMLFRDQRQNMKIHPCLEINLRYNMSTLALVFNRYLHPETRGIFKVYFQPNATFDQFHKEMTEKYPFQLKDGKWYKGYLPLVSFNQHKCWGAYLLLRTY